MKKTEEKLSGVFVGVLFIMVFVEVLFIGALASTSTPTSTQIAARCRHHYGVRSVNQASLPFEDTVVVCNDGTARWK